MNVLQVSLESLAEEPSVSVLRLSGDIGMEHISGIVQRVDALPENKRAHLLIDLSAVGFLSSPVVGALMGCRERLSRKGSSISLLSPRPELAEKLDLMGVNLVFRHYRTKEDFLKDFRWEAREESRKLQLQIPARAGMSLPCAISFPVCFSAKDILPGKRSCWSPSWMNSPITRLSTDTRRIKNFV